jgi:AcrR family transcriptional regulator
LPLDRIVSAALELVDEQGADALSMRSLAQRLGSGTATLYRHFANRAELVAMVVDTMIGEVTFDASSTWDDACTSFAQNMFEALGRHGNAARLLIGQVPLGPNAVHQRELLLAVLLDNGFAPQTAARIYATVSRYILGFAMQVAGSTTAEQHDAEVSAAFRRLDPARYPATVTVADELPVPLAAEFSFGLRLMMAGLTAAKSQ